MKRKIANKPEAKSKKKVLHEVGANKSSWRKTTLGALYPFRDRSICVRQGEIVQATAEELGNKIDQFELVSGDAAAFTGNAGSENVSVTITDNSLDKKVFSLKEVEPDWYNVESASGEVMNNEKLSLADAEALKVALEEEGK
jgi:hypothetical protein